MSRRDGSLEKLSQLLASGRYPAQSRLPPERELARLLGVSRSGLREGLKILEAEERIWRRVGKGTFVGPRPLGGASGLDLVSAMTSPDEVLEVRLLVEPLIARLAAMRATSSEIENMRRLLEKSEAARDVKAWELWDGTLHRAVAQPAHNQLLLAIFDAVNAMRSQAAWSRLRLVALSPGGSTSIAASTATMSAPSARAIRRGRRTRCGGISRPSRATCWTRGAARMPSRLPRASRRSHRPGPGQRNSGRPAELPDPCSAVIPVRSSVDHA
jgi:DNA-binding FadR family transcriptional regulator